MVVGTNSPREKDSIYFNTSVTQRYIFQGENTLQRDDLPGGLDGAPCEAGEVSKVVGAHVQDGQGVDVDVGSLLHLGGLEAASAAVAGVHVADWRGETNSN